MGIANESWLLLALFAMACFSISSVLLKVIVSEYGIDVVLKDALGFTLRPSVQYSLGVIVLSLVGFGALMLALQQGKVALVNAILSLSTVVIAGLSYAFLGDRFSVREMVALALALASIVVLAL